MWAVQDVCSSKGKGLFEWVADSDGLVTGQTCLWDPNYFFQTGFKADALVGNMQRR
jgi:hypothetical protein